MDGLAVDVVRQVTLGLLGCLQHQETELLPLGANAIHLLLFALQVRTHRVEHAERVLHRFLQRVHLVLVGGGDVIARVCPRLAELCACALQRPQLGEQTLNCDEVRVIALRQLGFGMPVQLQLSPRRQVLLRQATVLMHEPLCLAVLVCQFRSHLLVVAHGFFGGLFQLPVCVLHKLLFGCPDPSLHLLAQTVLLLSGLAFEVSDDLFVLFALLEQLHLCVLELVLQFSFPGNKHVEIAELLLVPPDLPSKLGGVFARLALFAHQTLVEFFAV